MFVSGIFMFEGKAIEVTDLLGDCQAQPHAFGCC